jgi:hypothetical protein
MKAVAGVFRSRDAARMSAAELLRSGFSRDQVNLLMPGASEEQIHSLPASAMEQPGVGSAIGGMVGAAVGVAGGLELGVGVTALIPGVGPVLAAGVVGAAILGAGGLLAGAELGGAADEKATEGVPADEVFFYEDALRQGRSVLISLANDDEEARRARNVLARAGAESIDAAREDWWIGVRDDEAEHYRALGRNFEEDEQIYRAGFEAALRRVCRGKSVDETADCLKWWYPKTWDTEAFRCGYNRGRLYAEAQEQISETRK